MSSWMRRLVTGACGSSASGASIRGAARCGERRARGGRKPVVGRIYRDMRGTSGPERLERVLVALAELQSGVVGRRQLLDLGFSEHMIDRRVRMGWLIPILNGVYAVGHRPRLLRGWHCAALLAAGERSALSHRSAGAHWAMTKPPGRPHVIAPRSADGIKGIVVHRPRALAEGDIVENQGLRVASPARVLLDLAGEGASRRQLERALDQAEINLLHLPIGPLLKRC